MTSTVAARAPAVIGTGVKTTRARPEQGSMGQVGRRRVAESTGRVWSSRRMRAIRTPVPGDRVAGATGPVGAEAGHPDRGAGADAVDSTAEGLVGGQRNRGGRGGGGRESGKRTG